MGRDFLLCLGLCSCHVLLKRRLRRLQLSENLESCCSLFAIFAFFEDMLHGIHYFVEHEWQKWRIPTEKKKSIKTTTILQNMGKTIDNWWILCKDYHYNVEVDSQSGKYERWYKRKTTNKQTNNKKSKTKLKITASKRSSTSFCWFVVDSLKLCVVSYPFISILNLAFLLLDSVGRSQKQS